MNDLCVSVMLGKQLHVCEYVCTFTFHGLFPPPSSSSSSHHNHHFLSCLPRQLLPFALRGTFQNAGQNCVGAERFYVYDKVHDEFVDKVTSIVKRMKQAVPLLNKDADVGATVTAAQVWCLWVLVLIVRGATCVRVCGLFMGFVRYGVHNLVRFVPTRLTPSFFLP
jgi:hypothetical protein